MKFSILNRSMSMTFVVLVAVWGSFAETAQAADARLHVQFTTTDCGGTYAPRHVHAVWIKDAAGNFVATIGTTTTDNKRAVWANNQASRLVEWYSNNPQANTDVAARTGATTSTFQTYSFDWDWRNTNGAIVPDGNYQIHFLQTSSNSGTPNNKAVFNITKGTSSWSTGPASQGGYVNVSLSYTPATLGVDAAAATNITSESATLNGSVTGITGGVNPDVRIYWGLTDGGTTPSNWNNEISLGSKGIGAFSTDIINLDPVTTYYYRCFVTDSVTQAWSDAVSFETPNPDYAQINVSPQAIAFGQVQVNSTTDSTVTIQNLGKLPLQINSLEFVGLESKVYSLVSPPALPFVIAPYQPSTPANWLNRDIGSVAAAGSVAFNGDLITVKGSGSDIWGEDDEFHFVYQTLTGDGQIIARVDSVLNTDGWAKAGVMMRNSLGSDEVRNVFMAITPSNGPTFQWRNDEDTDSSHTYSYTAPYWVKLVRSGNTYSGYISSNGVNWTQQGTSQTFSMNSTLYVGLAVTSHNDGTLCTTVFSNVGGSIQMPSDEVIDEKALTVRFNPRSVQDYKYAKLAIGSNDPGKISYVDLQGTGGPNVTVGTRQVGGIGGPAKAVAMYGDNVLVGQGAMLVLLDVSNPAMPTRLNQIRLDGVIEALTVQGDTAYAALGNKGVAVVDLKDFMPLAGAMTIETGGYASDIDSEGNVLCVADGIAGTHVYDISTALNPIFVKTFETTGSATSVDISSGILYILDESNGMQRATLNPASVTGSYPDLEFGTRVTTSGTTAYAVDSFGNLSTLDASGSIGLDSETLLQVGSAANIEVQNGYAYITGQGGLEVLEISNPAAPGIVALDPGFSGTDIVINGTVAYVAAGADGLKVLDVSNPSTVSSLGTYTLMSASGGVASSGSLDAVYAGGSDQNLTRYDLSTPTNPGVSNAYENSFHAQDIELQGQYAYVATGLEGFKVFDLSNPAGTPAVFAPGGFTSAVSVNGSKAMICDSNEVYVLDVSSPMSPFLIGSLGMAGWASDVAVGTTHGYIAEGGMGIKILNLSNAQAVGYIPVSGIAYGVAIDGNILYVACGTAGVTVLNVADPANPLPVAEYDLPGVITDVTKVGNKLCAVDATHGVSILDISNPAAPTLYANAATNTPAFHISSAGSRVLVADKNGGLAVLAVTGWPKEMIGDISNDYQVNLDDLVLMAGNWLNSESNLDVLGANLDYYDTIVNMKDLAVLSGYWQRQYENPASLMLHLKLDETSGSTASDSSSNGHDGTLMNMDNSDWVPGKKGGALSFDGINDYVEIPGYKGITGTADRTCMAWVKTSDADKELLSWGSADIGGKWLMLIDSNGHLRIAVNGGYIVGNSLLTDGQWHHIAAVLADDGSPDISETTLYVDGQPETISDSADEPVNTGTTQNLQIGWCEIQATNRFFNGLIDEVKIYSRVLSDTEIQFMYE